MSTSRARWNIRLTGNALAFLASGAALFAPSQAAAEYVSYRFEEPIPLTLDVTQVAVRMQGDPGLQSAELEALGLRAEAREPMDISPWWRVPVEPGRQTAASIEAVVASLAARPDVAFATPVFVDDFGGPLLPTEYLLVQFAPSVSTGSAESLLLAADRTADLGGRDWADLPGAYRVELSTRNGFEALALAADLARRGETRFAELDMIFTGRGSFIPNDTGFANCWGLNNTGQTGGTPDADMDAVEAWDVTLGDPGILVAIIDVGTQQNHPDINQVPGADMTGEGGGGGPVNACDKHGTAVSGCVSATVNNALGTAGVSPACRTFSIRTFISSLACDGNWSTAISWTVDALTAAENAGCRVSNNSNGYGFTSATIDAKYAATRTNGMVHFASAGNSGASSIGYPASIATVNAVAALDHNGVRASFSQYGTGLAFSAPGVNIYTTDRTGGDGYIGGDYVSVNGTSFASPYAAGVAALALSRGPALTAAQVEAFMQTTSVDLGPAGYDTGYGWGFVNANNIVNAVSCPPEMFVSTTSINVAYPLGGFGDELLAIQNDAPVGCDVLNWTIVEDNVPGGGDCPWITVPVSADFIPAGSASAPTISIDAFGLAPGVYNCNLRVAGDDPNNPLVIVPVQLVVTGSIAAATVGECYGTQGYAGTGEFLRIDPGTGAGTIIGNTRVGGIPGLAINSVGEIYGVGGPNSSVQDLYRIDAATGAVVFLGNTGIGCFQAMAFDENDVLYAAGTCGADFLYRVNTTNGALTTIASLAPDMVGLSFDPTDGTLYGVEWNQSLGLDNLYTIDKTTGATAFVGSFGLGVGIGDIHFDAAGNLYGVIGGGSGTNQLVAVEKVTGAATVIGPVGFPAVTGLDLFKCAGQIAVTPNSWNIALPLGGTTNGFLQIANGAAGCSLDWTLTENAVPGGGDCAWLVPSAVAGTIPASDSTTIGVDIDAFGLAPGVYTCNVDITSDDPITPLVTVPVQLTVTGSIANATDGVSYGTQGYTGTGELLRIDPGTGAGTIIGNTRVGGMPGLAINSAGEIYGVGGPSSSVQDLYRIDAATGAVVFLGNTGISCFQAMAFDASDVLYGIGICGPDSLYTVGTNDGTLTAIASVDPNMVGLSFDPTNDTLYGVEWNNFAGLDNLYRIDKATGATTLVGSLGLGVGVGDIFFDASGNLFGSIGGGSGVNSLVSIDKTTGVGTVIGPIGFTITGLDCATPSTVDAPQIATPRPLTNALRAASPNPFNPSTRIRFEMPNEGHVKVAVYDAAGRRVRTLVDGVMSAGVHDVSFRSDGLASGVYFYEMRTEGFREVRKMTVLR